MKNWIGRLMSGSEKDAPAKGNDAAPDEAESDVDPSDEIDATYYRWLTASSGYDASEELQERILDQVRDLARHPDTAAELVPRMPELIPQLLEGLLDEEMSGTELARQIAQDTVLVAEVIREANSAYYRPTTPVKNVEAAIMMLGNNGLRMLLARIAFRPLIKMQLSGFARHAAPLIWNQSERCALGASMMAPGNAAGVFVSYLAGLMQNVGLIVAFRIADKLCEGGRVPISSDFGLQLFAASRQLSAVIAKHWDFQQEVADAIARVEDGADAGLTQALAQGDRIAKLSQLIDAEVIAEDDELVTGQLDNFQRRCLGKLRNLGA